MPIIAENSLPAMLSPHVSIRPVEPQIYSVLGETASSNFFDQNANFYDRVICHPLYNRLVWGYSVQDYDILTEKTLASAIEGWILDAGCGSLAFTAAAYLRHPQRPVILLDHSLKLLQLAKSRLIGLNGQVPRNMFFLQADALDLPFKPKIFQAIISLNLLHVLEDIRKVLAGLKNTLKDHGTMTFTTLIENNRLADKYLRMMGRAGMAIPRTAPQLEAIFHQLLAVPVKFDIRGNMTFIEC